MGIPRGICVCTQLMILARVFWPSLADSKDVITYAEAIKNVDKSLEFLGARPKVAESWREIFSMIEDWKGPKPCQRQFSFGCEGRPSPTQPTIRIPYQTWSGEQRHDCRWIPCDRFVHLTGLLTERWSVSNWEFSWLFGVVDLYLEMDLVTSTWLFTYSVLSELWPIWMGY